LGKLAEKTVPDLQTFAADSEEKLEKLQQNVADTYTALLSHAGRRQPSKKEWVTECMMCCSLVKIR